MISQELIEASTFRKRSTSEMTYGFEFEVIVDKDDEEQVSQEDVYARIRNEYPFEDFVISKSKNFNFKNHKPKYGFASKEDIADFFTKKQPIRQKLVKEILNLNDKKYQLYYLMLLKDFIKKSRLKIDNISDFDNELKNEFDENLLSRNYKLASEMDEDDVNNYINSLLNASFRYFSESINDKTTYNFIYNKDKNIIFLKKGITIDDIEELFENSFDILEDLEEDYNEFIVELAYDEEMNNGDNYDISYFKELLSRNDINNVEIEYDTSLGSDGIEIVTDKIYGIDEAINIFNKITKFIQNEDKLITNEKTGLHVNIGTWDDISQLDLTKLLVFSNETQILKNMRRQENKYTTSLVKGMLAYLENQNTKSFDNYNKIIKNMNKEILASANHTSFMDFNKLLNDGYIEIRGFGNRNYEYKKDYIIKMIRYLSRVMEIASDPEEAKQQYIKKLYKVFDFSSDLSGEKEQKVTNSVITNDEIDKIIRFFPKNKKKSYKEKFKNIEKNHNIILQEFIPSLIEYDKEFSNNDLKILYKLLKNMNITKQYYEIKLKGKSKKIDNLFQNYLFKEKV